MGQTEFIIIAAVFGVSFLAMIPILIFRKKKTANTQEFIDNFLQTDAILRFGGIKFLLDGYQITDHYKTKDEDMNDVYAIEPGEHEITCRFEFTTTSLGSNQNHKTKDIRFRANFERGKEYSLYISPYYDYSNHTNIDDFFVIPLSSDAGIQSSSVYLVFVEKKYWDNK